MRVAKLGFEAGGKVGSCMREFISARVGCGAARSVPNLGSKLNACLVVRKVFRSLGDGDEGRGLGLVAEGFAIFVVQFNDSMGKLS